MNKKFMTMTDRFQSLEAIFNAHFATPTSDQQADIHYFAAPGRVNLIGEHTDYNDGFVLPCAIDRHALAIARTRSDRSIHVIAVDYEQQSDTFEIDQAITPHDQYTWANYIRGVVSTLIKRGYQFTGMDIAISGNIPQGAGLSSSAALEVLIVQCFNTLYSLGISQTDMALIGQQAENEFVGCLCGVMDQLISAKGVDGHALLIDCRSLDTRPVTLPDTLRILIIHSNKPRGLVDSAYNTRRQQCEAAAEYFGVKALRDVNQAQLDAANDLDAIITKRARHVISENARTLAAADALTAGNIPLLSQLMAASHASMRDDFEITVPEIDWLVKTVSDYLGERGGVRMTGGGFGGCVIALVPKESITHIQQLIDAGYHETFGRQAGYYLCQASQGASPININR